MARKPKTETPSDEDRADTPTPALAGASDHLKEVRDLKRRVQIGVYSAVLGVQALDYFVLGFTTFQLLVAGIVAFIITIVAVEGAFVHGLQLRKRSAYPRVILAELGGVYTVSEAAARTLAVVQRLLGLRASFIIIRDSDDSLNLASVSGMGRESAEQLLQVGMPKLQEAMRTVRPVRLDLPPVLPEGVDSRHDRVVFIPVMTLHEPMGVLVVIGVKGNRDLKDSQLLSDIGMALGLSLENLRQKETILHLAYHDALTSLPNRTLFQDRLSVALAQARRRGQLAAVMFLDLDRFKVVNDTVGHAVGDQLLRSVAERLKTFVRDGDTVARVGGDEFTLLLPELERMEDAVDVADRILETLRKPWVLNGHEFHVTTSIGIAVWPDDGEDAEALLRNADTAMYRAKDQGRDNYKLYTPKMNARVMERLALENSLRHGLERGEFLVHYQPQVEIASGRIVGAEALVRWQHPDGQLVPPGEFIGVAEDTGLIVPLGAWVLRTACAQNKAWQDAGLPPMRVAVNLSARQFQLRDLIDDVAEALAETGLDPRHLQLEITEGVAMQDMEFSVTMLRELREMGVQIAMDDFGTGHSSLSYLKRFPIDFVKIDQSFVRDLTVDPSDAAIASSIIAMAHNLNLKVIAEGVETAEQLAFLKDRRCDEMQGYLFSRPVPSEELERMLKRRGRRPRARAPVDLG